PFAAEILGFYIELARFQESLCQRLERASGKLAISHSAPLDSPELIASFSAFLSLVEDKGPARLAQVAHDLRGSNPESWPDLFTQVWSNIDSPSDPREFLVLGFLQPCAEF